MLKVFFKNWSLIISPSDHFMAVYVVLVVRFQFHIYFLAEVATKNRILVLFYGVLNSVCYPGCFLVLQKLIVNSLWLCVVGID